MFCLVSSTLYAVGLCICRDLGIDKSRQRLAQVNNNKINIKIISLFNQCWERSQAKVISNQNHKAKNHQSQSDLKSK